jgi:uncharacterized protein YjcR
MSRDLHRLNDPDAKAFMEKRFRKLHAEGLRNVDIAERLGVRSSSVPPMLRRYGLKSNRVCTCGTLDSRKHAPGCGVMRP